MHWKNREFTEAYNIFFPIIFSAASSKVSNLSDAEDLCQEIFLKLYEKIETIEDKKRWLFGALRLQLLKYYENHNPETDVEKLLQDKNLAFTNGARDLRIIIREVIEDSSNFRSDDEEALFELIAIRNFTYEEAGRQLGLSKRSARYRYNRIIDRLLDELKKKGINNFEDLL